MFRKLLLVGAVFALSSGMYSAVAADAVVDADAAAKKELSIKLHASWGVKDQVKELVEMIAVRIPLAQQVEFRRYMYKVLDLEKIQAISVNTAVDTFTKEELEAMVSYYTSAVGKSAESKRKAYNDALMPQVRTMMDKGIADAMTGMKGMNGIQPNVIP